MEAAPARVIQYFDGEKQNLIPLFQRPYTWQKKNWQALWDDVMVQYDLGDTGTHFLGAIVSIPARSVPVGVNKYLIIDGQQRLTTISLLLSALRDCLDEKSAARIQQVYLTNRFSSLEDTLKLVPTQQDRDAYRTITLDRNIPVDGSLMAEAYHFFKNQLTQGRDPNDDLVIPPKVLTTLERCLQVVMINLGETDDPYLIFESLNFKGEPLTQADLVRNYLLMRFRHSISIDGEQERIYSTYWRPMENMLGGDLTEFLRHYLMKDGDNIRQGGIYAAIKAKLKDIDSPQAVEEEIKSLQRFGQFYAKILLKSQETEAVIRERLENINQLEVTTSYPLLLRLFDARESGHLNNAELEKCLGLVESFVVRRAVCGVPTNALNKLFIQWAKNFPDADHVHWLHSSMSAGSASRNFPKNPEFAKAFASQPQYGRGATRFILCELEESFRHKEPVELASTTIEHVLPQTLTQQWKDELGADPDAVHARLLDTFGNLTLTGYNPELGNIPFSEKKTKLENTHIELNRWIIQQANWRAVEIEERAKTMLVRAYELWPGPLVIDSQ